MPTGEQKTSTAFAMSVTAAIRARLGVMGESIRWLAGETDVSSNYLSKRLRDVSPLTLDDVSAIVRVIGAGMTPEQFMAQAWERYRVEAEQKLRRISEEKSLGLPEQPSGDAHQLGDGAPSLDTGKPGVTLRATRQPQTPGQRSTPPHPDIDQNL